MHTDVLIVGGGPAGSAAALTCLNYGIGCLLVEAKAYPRHKLCGGLLTAKARHLLNTLVSDVAARECLEACVVSRETEFSLWNGVQGGDLEQVVKVTLQEPITLVDRVRFDEWLARRFEQLGDQCRHGRLIEGDAVTAIDFEQRMATLASGRRIEYRSIIAADGANSFVEKCAIQQSGGKWVSRRATMPDAFCLETEVPRSLCPDLTGVRIYFGVVPCSYAWAFAKGDHVCLGLVGEPGDSRDLKATFHEFLAHVGLASPEKLTIHGAMLPLGNPMEKPVQKKWRLFFVGDAAGYVDPLTGEGIYSAMQSGVWVIDAHWVTIANSRVSHAMFPTPEQRAEVDEALAGAYLSRMKHLRRLVRKSGGYHRWLMHPRVKPLFLRLASRHPRFVEYFYTTQIEHVSLHSFPRIVWRYLTGKIYPPPLNPLSSCATA